MQRTSPLLPLILFLVSCAGDGSRPGAIKPTGPPEVRIDVSRDHALQFDQEVPDRPAGSQEEQVAAIYILGHLQQAGYLARLEAVPVANLVESTDVIALPPGGEDPAAVVAVAYDTAPGDSGGGASIGLFLELARALRVVDADHFVEFVALGAEHARARDGLLGSRRFARLLLDADAHPVIIIIGEVGVGGEGFSAGGTVAADLLSTARSLDAPAAQVEPASPSARVFAEAGLDHAVVAGGLADLAAVLLSYLSNLSV